MLDYKETHWLDVREILSDAIEDVAFMPRMVSDSDEAGVIHKTIIQNLYENPIVVCDVSGKNANVMLELGMRLSFNKPVIIVKDSKTSYSFDTSPIEHLEYPSDLRFSTIVDFKKRLGEKIVATSENYKRDPKKNSFLGTFGAFQSVNIDSEEVSPDMAILRELHDLKNSMRHLRVTSRSHSKESENNIGPEYWMEISNSIKAYKRLNGIKTKTDTRNRKEEIKDFVEDNTRAPSKFNSHKEFSQWFEPVFNSLYG